MKTYLNFKEYKKESGSDLISLSLKNAIKKFNQKKLGHLDKKCLLYTFFGEKNVDWI